MFEQSASLAQAAHAPALHAEAVAVVQSACFKHATHWPAVVSQNGFVMSLQSAAAVHSTQAFDAVSQAGFGAAHCELSVHSTQALVAARHTEVVPLHLPSHGAVPAAPAVPASPESPAPVVPLVPEAPLVPDSPLDEPPPCAPPAPPWPVPDEPALPMPPVGGAYVPHEPVSLQLELQPETLDAAAPIPPRTQSPYRIVRIF